MEKTVGKQAQTIETVSMSNGQTKAGSGTATIVENLVQEITQELNLLSGIAMVGFVESATMQEQVKRTRQMILDYLKELTSLQKEELGSTSMESEIMNCKTIIYMKALPGYPCAFMVHPKYLTCDQSVDFNCAECLGMGRNTKLFLCQE
jgi:pyridoxal/pyridoxine/pyridoxamine kinase